METLTGTRETDWLVIEWLVKSEKQHVWKKDHIHFVLGTRDLIALMCSCRYFQRWIKNNQSIWKMFWFYHYPDELRYGITWGELHPERKSNPYFPKSRKWNMWCVERAKRHLTTVKTKLTRKWSKDWNKLCRRYLKIRRSKFAVKATDQMRNELYRNKSRNWWEFKIDPKILEEHSPYKQTFITNEGRMVIDIDDEFEELFTIPNCLS